MPDVPHPHGPFPAQGPYGQQPGRHDPRYGDPATPEDLFTAAALPPGQADQTGPAASSSGTGFPILDAALDRAVAVPSAVIHAHVDRLRRRNPEASPAQIVTMLEKQYLLAVSASGGAVGAAAATPAIGTGVGIALTSAEVATFFGASSAFALAVADVHGIGVEDTARRRTLLMATVLGDQGSQAISGEVGLNGSWARTLLVNMPTTTIKRVNARLARRFIRRQATKQGALAFGRLAPFGIGAVIGATGARALGKTVVHSARQAFGPPPPRFPRIIELAVSEGTAPAVTDGRTVRMVEASPDPDSRR